MDLKTIALSVASLVKQWLDKKGSVINHNAVTKTIYLEVDVSAGYFLVLSIANLIALSGLITNNTAAIIGAMLVSPLMGPILSSGFAFITENTLIGKKALKKIFLSVALTILIAAIATYVSPLKDVTDEIMSRTRPNLYDLIIAFLAGTVGAIALCTKKNYLTIVTGVAIATAVIPPLSVAGFGAGSGNLSIAFGGFFLFFTNFVAIIISTCVVFFIYGFRPGMTTQESASQIRKRFAFLAFILVIISIPLLYTLHESISEARLRAGVQSALQNEFNREKQSHLSAFTYAEGKEGKLEISAVINTVRYLRESEIENAVNSIKAFLKRDISLNSEQILVQSGGLKQEMLNVSSLTGGVHQKTAETAKGAIENASGAVRKIAADMERIIAPSTIAEFYVGYHFKDGPLPIYLKIRRDSPLSDSERKWLARLLSEAVKMPVELNAGVVPYVEPLVFGDGQTEIPDEMKNSIASVKDIYGKDQGISIMIESYPALSESPGKRNALARKRAERISDVLVNVFKIPEERLKKAFSKRLEKRPVVKIFILNEKRPSEKLKGLPL